MDIEIPQALEKWSNETYKTRSEAQNSIACFTLLSEHPLKINTLDIIQPFLLSFGSKLERELWVCFTKHYREKII